jgi:dihydrofolate reductase
MAAMRSILIHGHAIVSADDMIADANGRMPEALMNEVDFAYFQEHLDAADLIVLGRIGHEAHANTKKRRRLVVSASGTGLEYRADAIWWNPVIVLWEEAAVRLLPSGGHVAVPGGRRVFDLFLEIGYDSFHLARANKACLGEGTPLFSACSELDASGKLFRQSADMILTTSGLVPGSHEIIDHGADVTRVVWRRPV